MLKALNFKIFRFSNKNFIHNMMNYLTVVCGQKNVKKAKNFQVSTHSNGTEQR